MVNEPLLWQAFGLCYLGLITGVSVMGDGKGSYWSYGTCAARILAIIGSFVMWIMALVNLLKMDPIPIAPGPQHNHLGKFRYAFGFYTIANVSYMVMMIVSLLRGWSKSTYNGNSKAAFTYSHLEMMKGATVKCPGAKDAVVFVPTENDAFSLSLGNWRHAPFLPVVVLTAWFGLALTIQTHGHVTYPGMPSWDHWTSINVATVTISLFSLVFSFVFFALDKNIMFLQSGNVFNSDTTGTILHVLIPKPIISALTMVNLSFLLTFFSDYGRFPVALLFAVIYPYYMIAKCGSYSVWFQFTMIGCKALFDFYFIPSLTYGTYGYDDALDADLTGSTWRWFHFLKDEKNTVLTPAVYEVAGIQYFFSISGLIVCTFGLYVFTMVTHGLMSPTVFFNKVTKSLASGNNGHRRANRDDIDLPGSFDNNA